MTDVDGRQHYLDRAQEYERLIKGIGSRRWRIIIAFYTLHSLVKAVLFKKFPDEFWELEKLHDESDLTRKKISGYALMKKCIRIDPDLKRCSESFRALRELSFKARYTMWRPEKEAVEEALGELKYAKTVLTPLIR